MDDLLSRTAGSLQAGSLMEGPVKVVLHPLWPGPGAYNMKTYLGYRLGRAQRLGAPAGPGLELGKQ